MKMRNSPLWILALSTLMALTLCNSEMKQNAIDKLAFQNQASRMVMMDLMNAESGQRGYLITNDRKYLDSYECGVSNFESDLKLLSDRSVPNDARINEIRELGKCKTTELAATIDMMNKKGYETARAIVLTNTGRNCMKDVQSILMTMQKANTTSIYAIKAKLRWDLRASEYALMAAIGLFLVSWWLQVLVVFRRKLSV